MTDYDTRLERLLAIAAAVFAEKGYHPTTMRDLARETGMSLAGMYHYVEGKDELLFEVQKRCFSEVLAGAEQALSDAGDARGRLIGFIQHHVTFFAAHMSEMKVLSHEAESLRGERLETITQLKRSYVALLTGLIRQVRDPDEADMEDSVAAYALFGMMNWIYTWYDPTGPVPPETLAEQFTQLFLNGMDSPITTPVSPGG